MLYHDARPYQEAATEAASHARTKLEALIHFGAQRAAQVIEAVQNNQPEDKLIRAHALRFSPDDQDLILTAGDVQHRIHRNALQQAASRVGLPWSYVQLLLSEDNSRWGTDLIGASAKTPC